MNIDIEELEAKLQIGKLKRIITEQSHLVKELYDELVITEHRLNDNNIEKSLVNLLDQIDNLKKVSEDHINMINGKIKNNEKITELRIILTKYYNNIGTFTAIISDIEKQVKLNLYSESKEVIKSIFDNVSSNIKNLHNVFYPPQEASENVNNKSNNDQKKDNTSKSIFTRASEWIYSFWK